MKIIIIEKNEISRIQPMWDELNKLHGQLSAHFKDHFKTFTFDDRVKQFQDRDSILIFAAKTESGLIGYCIVSVKGKVGEIDSVYISPQYRGEGIGEKLINNAESWLKTQNIIKIHIAVAQGNEAVFPFYNKHGYYPRFTVLEKKV